MTELKRAKGWYEEQKKKRFRIFVKQFRKDTLQTLKLLQNLQSTKWYTLKDYQKICRDFTELTIKHESIDISGRDVRGIHIDHIIPISSLNLQYD